MAEANVVERLYAAFSERDGDAMAACYAPDATFQDPVFSLHSGQDVGDMWRMLCERGKDLVVEASDIQLEGDTASAHWEADYTFSTGRKVHNVIDASFVLRDGLILHHVDRFDLWKWTRMALGPMGIVLGWSPLVQGRVRTEALKGLRAYQQR